MFQKKRRKNKRMVQQSVGKFNKEEVIIRWKQTSHSIENIWSN